MSTTAARNAADYESRLQQYYFERSEEGRAVRVGEKEVSEQAAIVARYRDLFTRPQIEALLEAEQSASGDERERLYRLRKTCEGGVIAAELVEQEDALENAILAARVIRCTTSGGLDGITQARGFFCGRSSVSSRMFGIAVMSNPSASVVAREISTARSFVYVVSSGESLRR